MYSSAFTRANKPHVIAISSVKSLTRYPGIFLSNIIVSPVKRWNCVLVLETVYLTRRIYRDNWKFWCNPKRFENRAIKNWSQTFCHLLKLGKSSKVNKKSISPRYICVVQACTVRGTAINSCLVVILREDSLSSNQDTILVSRFGKTDRHNYPSGICFQLDSFSS